MPDTSVDLASVSAPAAVHELVASGPGQGFELPGAANLDILVRANVFAVSKGTTCRDPLVTGSEL